jgi:2-polyprenyl-3-methyl-5-hydroxy-6-metoxy-1,4-benzoquinol methylase
MTTHSRTATRDRAEPQLRWQLSGLLVCCTALATLSLACRERATASEATTSTATAAQAPSSSTVPGSLRHDPANPPIDCPLRKAGIDPNGLKPFEDVEKYIAFLERPDRDGWQKPDALVASLGLAGGETVADVGAGSGYFTFRFARALPHGKVVATDIEPEMVRHIHHKAMSEGIANVEVVLGDQGDPKIPAGANLIFICDVLHHVANREAWLSTMYAEAMSSARLVVVEFKEGELPEGPPKSLKMPRNEVAKLVTNAGFAKIAEDSELLPYQFVLTFNKP